MKLFVLMNSDIKYISLGPILTGIFTLCHDYGYYNGLVGDCEFPERESLKFDSSLCL